MAEPTEKRLAEAPLSGSEFMVQDPTGHPTELRVSREVIPAEA